MSKYIIAFGRAWVVTPQAYKEIQETLHSIYGPKSKDLQKTEANEDEP